MALGLFDGRTRPLVDGDGAGGHYPFVKIAGFGAGVATTIEGKQANATAVATVNPVLIGMEDGGALIRRPFGDVVTTDTKTGAAFMLHTSSFNLVYNPGTSQWERTRSANGADGTTGTGLLGVGNMVFDGTNWQQLLGDTSGRPLVNGPAAAGASATGVNPFAVAGLNSGNNQPVGAFNQASDGLSAAAAFCLEVGALGRLINAAGTMDRQRSANGATNTTGTGLLGAGVLGFDGTNYQALRVGLVTGAGAGAVLNSLPLNFNAATYDANRNNTDETVLTSAARTTIQTVTFTNYNSTHLRVVLDVTTAGTGSITLSIEAQDAISGKWVALLTGAAVTTVSTNVYEVGPSLTAAANATANRALSRNMRIVVTHNNANTITYSVGRQLTGV